MRISRNWIHEAKDRTEWQFDDDNDDLEVQKQTL